MPEHYIGDPLPRKDGLEKVTGKALYTDDITMPEMLHGVTVRSPIARGRIRDIRFRPGIPWEEFTVVAAHDIPGKNVVTLIVDDQPYLADQVVNHPEEPILLLAHPDRYLLEEARRAVEVEIDLLPAVFTIEDSLAQKATVWGDNNIFKTISVNKGEIESVWQHAHVIV